MSWHCELPLGILANGNINETSWMAFMLVLTLVVIVANDLWKRRLVKRAEERSKPVAANWRNNQTNWKFLAFFVAVFLVFLYVRANPHLTDRDFGRFNPIIRHLFHQDFHRQPAVQNE